MSRSTRSSASVSAGACSAGTTLAQAWSAQSADAQAGAVARTVDLGMRAPDLTRGSAAQRAARGAAAITAATRATPSPATRAPRQAPRQQRPRDDRDASSVAYATEAELSVSPGEAASRAAAVGRPSGRITAARRRSSAYGSCSKAATSAWSAPAPRSESTPTDDEDRDLRWPSSVGEEGQEQPPLQREHLLLVLGLGVVVAEQVQDAVGREQQHLLLGGVARGLRLARGDGGHTTMSPSSPAGVGGSAVPGRNSSIGKLSTSVGPGSSIHWMWSCSIAGSSTNRMASSAPSAMCISRKHVLREFGELHLVDRGVRLVVDVDHGLSSLRAAEGRRCCPSFGRPRAAALVVSAAYAVMMSLTRRWRTTSSAPSSQNAMSSTPARMSRAARSPDCVPTW